MSPVRSKKSEISADSHEANRTSNGMSIYKLCVGLEIHAELKTQTKMFCDSKNDPEEARPNVNICPVCMGYPGTLPVINKEAVRSVLRLGLAVGGTLADYTEFDRKNYFYPDIPKGYQLSQYKHPLVSGGELSGVKLTRIHLEEDTARSSHDKGEESLVDFNRAGVPLMEMVTEPVITSASQAVEFAKELQLLLQYLGASDANMEKGEMRIEANISVLRSDLKNPDSKVGPLGTKVEVKNINSFRAAGKAIEFEYKRQAELLERGESVVQETRGWDENKVETFSQRKKEESHDYRYFPDPDLPKLSLCEVSEFGEEILRHTLPELPREKRLRLIKLGLTPEHAEIYVTQPEKGKYFEEVIAALNDNKLIALTSNLITSDIKKLIEPTELVEVVRMLQRGEISSRGAKDILKIVEENGGSARVIAEEKKLMQESDREVLKKIVEDILSENGGGKKLNINYLVGLAMKKSAGRANPVVLQKLFLEMLDR